MNYWNSWEKMVKYFSNQGKRSNLKKELSKLSYLRFIFMKPSEVKSHSHLVLML